MHYIKPAWLTHSGEKKDYEVYSCHVSPDGSRLVTAAGDGNVRIWSTEAIYNAGDPAYTKPKQLCSMSHHTGTIHTVRFSSNNRYLASGADDKLVCIYILDPNPPSHAATFGTNEPPPVENWRSFKRLIGHENDVQDLGWSYDSSILVSVGLDSKVVVWSGFTFEKLKTLSHHQSHVKGLTFDPANKYFATASDDRTVKIFRFSPVTPNSSAHDQMNNFQLETTVVTPFTLSPLTTYFRRCSWSPDGNHIAAANAVNGPLSTIAVINRGSWDCEISLVGHEGPVEVAAFSPRLFCKDPHGPHNTDPQGYSSQNLVTVVACAGQDKSLTVWNTSYSRPVLIATDASTKSISDLAWAPDGRTLFSASLDGSINAVIFEEGDLGYTAIPEENERQLTKFGGGRRGADIIEGTDGLLLENLSKAGELRDVAGRMGELMGDSTGSKANGKGSSTPANGSTIPSSGAESAATNLPPTPQPAPDPKAVVIERLNQQITYTKDGKKRVKPFLLSSAAGAAQSSLPKSHLMASSGNNQGSKLDSPQSILDLSAPYDGLPKGGLLTLLLGNRIKASVVPVDENTPAERKKVSSGRNGVAPILQTGVDGLVTPLPPKPSNGIQPTPEFIRPAVINPSLSVSQVRLAVPKVRSFILRNLNNKGNESIDLPAHSQNLKDEYIVFEARNGSDREPSRINVTKRGQPVWQDYLPKSVLLVTGNHHFWSAACEDGSVYVWTPAGRRLLNALVLEAQPVILESKGWWLLCITAVGLCYIWNIQTLASPHPPVSLAPILDIAIHSLQLHSAGVPAVTSAHLNSEGRIIVTLTNGDGYTYSPSMFVWQRLTEVWWAVGSQYWNTTDSSISNIQSSENSPSKDQTPNLSAGIIPYLERNTTNEILLRGRATFLQRLIKSLLSREGFEGLESGVSIAHLENRLAAAMLLSAKEEFRLYLFMYAKRLGAEGIRVKVEELLRGVTGNMIQDKDEAEGTAIQSKSQTNIWESEGDSLCGWPRKDLLKGVILILGKHRELQRLTVPCAKLLGVIDEDIEVDEAMVS
ncbi:MAG: HIR complex subunit [Trizodia sp. TS-e1964]|nr:MAG: HIR complex subunit [Trizodia sp. TS-e1964]